jgi:hypothetical protein
VVTGRDLSRGGAGLAANLLRLCNEETADAALTYARINDQSQDSDEGIVVLKPWNDVQRDEAQNVPTRFRDDDAR